MGWSRGLVCFDHLGISWGSLSLSLPNFKWKRSWNWCQISDIETKPPTPCLPAVHSPRRTDWPTLGSWDPKIEFSLGHWPHAIPYPDYTMVHLQTIQILKLFIKKKTSNSCKDIYIYIIHIPSHAHIPYILIAAIRTHNTSAKLSSFDSTCPASWASWSQTGAVVTRTESSRMPAPPINLWIGLSCRIFFFTTTKYTVYIYNHIYIYIHYSK